MYAKLINFMNNPLTVGPKYQNLSKTFIGFGILFHAFCAEDTLK